MARSKKYSIIAALLGVLLLCSCADGELPPVSGISEPESTPAVTTSATSTTARTASTTTATSAEESEETPEPVTVDAGLPRMDGSTSATPLEIGLKNGFLGIPYNEAKELVSHTTTHDSFKRLINGEVDLIFSVPISEEQRQMADEAGVTLFMEPVAREGFVFVVNADNPVDSLTSEQLRKIYSGEITNWSEVGGNDEPILPYQRNTDSGSQNYMTVFMGDTPLLPPKTDLVQGMMLSLMDAIAVYDNSAGAIGYSVYSYAAQMYANANKVKFISVDGVAPSKATMADESYPLLSCTYIIYTDKSPESAREFAEMALSDEGQGYVLDSGYLPVNGMEVPEKYLPYEAVGTGAPKPADFTPSRKYSRLYLDNDSVIVKDKYYELVFLKDEELQARINSDIRAAMDELRKYAPEKESTNCKSTDGITIRHSCKNGYLSLVLGYFDNSAGADAQMMTICAYHHAKTLNYDLIEGTRIERFSDLFYEGEDFLPEVNQSIADHIGQYIMGADNDYPENHIVQKQDFSCILGEPRLFTIDDIGLEPDNLYFTCAPFLTYSADDRQCIVSQYRDMSGLIADEYADDLSDREYDEWEISYVIEDGDTYKRITDSLYHTDEEIKAEDEFWYGLQRRAWEAIRRSNPDWHSTHTDIVTDKYENYYHIGLRTVATGETPFVNFDCDTLELITMEMLAGENWRQYLSGSDRWDKLSDEEIAGLQLIPSEWFGGVIVIALIENDTGNGSENSVPKATIGIPREAFNERYYPSQ